MANADRKYVLDQNIYVCFFKMKKTISYCPYWVIKNLQKMCLEFCLHSALHNSDLRHITDCIFILFFVPFKLSFIDLCHPSHFIHILLPRPYLFFTFNLLNVLSVSVQTVIEMELDWYEYHLLIMSDVCEYCNFG